MKRFNLALILVIAGCGSGTGKNGNNDLSLPDLATSGSGDMGNNADMTMIVQSTCGAPNAACSVGSQAGLCKAGNCAPCTDTTDDALCATAYGAGTICASGSCIVGCHDSSTCSGKICDPGSNMCRNCSQDPDCPASAPFCNTSTGTCGLTAPPCTNSMQCNSGAGFCCGGVCINGAVCCGNGDCTGNPAGTTCNTTTNQCYNTTNCTDALPGGKFYVNPSPSPGFSGQGTKQCPFTSLTTAIHNVPSPNPSNFKICTEGTFDSASDKNWPRYIATNVELDGTYCGDNTTHTIFTVPSAQPAVVFQQAGPASIHGVDINSAWGSNPGKTRTGIYVSNTGTTPTNPGSNPISIYDLSVHYFGTGIGVDTNTGDNAGNVAIGDNVHSGSNGIGLYVRAGAKVNVTTSDNTKYVSFENADSDGILVGRATLKINGQDSAGAGTETTVRCGGSSGNGIRITTGDSTSSIVIDHVHASGNASGSGLYTYNDAPLTVTNSFFNTNKYGLHVVQDPGSTSNQSVMTLNFGTMPTGSSAGFNTFSKNTSSSIYIDFANIDALPAQGNSFGTDKNCATGASPSPFPLAVSPKNCDKAYDLCGPVAGDKNQLTFATTATCSKCDCSQSSCPNSSCPQ
jgi:hypothetical protein